MNPKIKIKETKLLSDNWYVLNKVTYEYQKKNGEWETQSREAYDRGNGATILLYNKMQKTVVLTRQFRLPTYINGNNSGMMIEACAGLLDEDNAEDCIRKETEEETGYKVSKVEKIFESYMSPGSARTLRPCLSTRPPPRRSPRTCCSTAKAAVCRRRRRRRSWSMVSCATCCRS